MNSGERPLVRPDIRPALGDIRERGQRLEAAPRVGDWHEPELLNGALDAGAPFPLFAYRWAEHDEWPGSLQWKGALNLTGLVLPLEVMIIEPSHLILEGDGFFPLGMKTGSTTFTIVMAYVDITTGVVTIYEVT